MPMTSRGDPSAHGSRTDPPFLTFHLLTRTFAQRRGVLDLGIHDSAEQKHESRQIEP
jgi:hypothetical protein